MYPFYFWF